jgi:hypothetical protein
MQEVRILALGADPRITEAIKWSTPTFSYKGNIFSFTPANKFVSLLFHTGAQIRVAIPVWRMAGKLPGS